MNGNVGEVRAVLVENLKELHLPAMRGCFEETARRAEKETLSYEQYLLELAERECEERPPEADWKAAQGIRSTAREISGELRRQTPAREGESAAEGVVGRGIPGSQRELTHLRQSRRGEEPSPVCDCTRVDIGPWPEDQVHHLSPVGAGSVGRETRSAL